MVVLEDDLPRIRLDSMIIGTIEMVLIEGTIYTQQLSQCEMIASLIAPNVGQESRGYVVGNMKKSYQINHNLKLHIFYCKSRWMIAKVWHDTPNLVYTTIITCHNTLTAAGYDQSTEYNIVYAFDI